MQIDLGPIHIKYDSAKMDVALTDIPTLFHKIPGATDILSEVFQTGLNRYQLYNRLVRRDSMLNAALTKMAMMAARAYKGVILHPGEDLSGAENTILTAAQKKAEAFRFRELFYSCARRLLIDGDVVLTKDLPNARLNVLPMGMMTALNSMKDLENHPEIVSGPPGVYIYNEAAGASGWKVYKASDVVHVAIGNDVDEVTDNQGRVTWGIWSQSPIEALRPILFWRLQTMVNDMVWRKLYLPREHHVIDLTDVLNPGLYQGDTIDERKAAALKAGATAIDAYIEKLKNQMPDQGYVTPKVGDVKGVEISVIEPKSTTYVTPNDLLRQLGQAVTDTYFSKVGSEIKESYAAELVSSSYEQLAAEHYAGIIKDSLLTVLKESLEGDLEVINQLDLKLQLILPKDVETLTRQVAVVASSKIYTINEMREILGKDPLTEDDRELLFKELERLKNASQNILGPNANTSEEEAAQAKRGKPGSTSDAVTPENKFTSQKT